MEPGEGIFRWLVGAILVASLSVSAYFRLKARQQTGVIPRRRERPALIAARLLFAGPGVLALLAFLFRPEWVAFARLELPGWARWLGVGLGGAALPLLFWTLVTIGPNISETTLTKERHELITHGPYRFVRHPLYAAAGFFLLPGIALAAANGLLALLAVGGVAMIRWMVVPAEEDALIERFGERYRSYRDRTGAFLPRVGGSSPSGPRGG